MANLLHLRKFRLVPNSYRPEPNETPPDYPTTQLNKEKHIIEALKASACPNLVEVRLSEGCQWWWNDGWMHEFAYESDMNQHFGR